MYITLVVFSYHPFSSCPTLSQGLAPFPWKGDGLPDSPLAQGLLFDPHLLALGVLSNDTVTASNAGVELTHMVLQYLCL